MSERSCSVRVEEEQLRANLELSNEHGMTPSNPIKQWRSVVLATVAAQKMQANINDKAEVDPAGMPGISQVDSQLEYLMVVHTALVQQLNAFGIVLTLLVAVTSVAILQPPGSFDKGHMLTSRLVACFLMFSSLSFLLACTGLIAVIVGSASLFRPLFSRKPPSGSVEINNIVAAGQRTKDGVVYDDIPTLAAIVLDNLLRVRRLRMYLALSLGFCMLAFLCGACAILGLSLNRNLYMAIGTIIGSGVVLAVEIGFTLAGPTHPPRWLRKCARYLVNLGSGRLDPGLPKTTSGNVRILTMARTGPSSGRQIR